MSDEPSPPAPEPGRVELAAVLCLIGSEFLDFDLFWALPVWLVGNALVAVSSYWAPREKARGWLFLASGLPLLVATSVIGSRCAETGACGGGAAGWVIAVVLVAYFVLQTVTALRLLRGRRQPEE